MGAAPALLVSDVTSRAADVSALARDVAEVSEARADVSVTATLDELSVGWGAAAEIWFESLTLLEAVELSLPIAL
jgi:hypothetical protein